MIKLLIHNPADNNEEEMSSSPLSIEDLLQQTPLLELQTEDTFLTFSTLSKEANDDINPFGELEFLVDQLYEAGKRLSEGKFAILRSAGDWTPSFFIFEPSEKVTYFSLLGSFPEPYASYYPQENSPMYIKEDPDQRKDLYKYVNSNRTSLYPDDTYSLSSKSIQQIPFPTDELIISLIKQADLGTALLGRLKEK